MASRIEQGVVVSIKLLNHGWRFSKAKGGALLVLLAIADFANDEGVAYPSIPTLARKARLTPRNTQRSIRHLVATGELVIEEGKGPHRTHLYRIVLADRAQQTECQNVRVTKGHSDIYDKEGVTFQPVNPLKRTVIKKELSEGDIMSPSRQTAAAVETDPPQAVNSLFEEFWSLYPARRGKKLEKAKALKNFSRLTTEDHQLVMVAVSNYSSSELVSKGLGVKDPHRWICDDQGNEPWRDWIEPEVRAIKEPSNRKPQLPRTGFAEQDYDIAVW